MNYNMGEGNGMWKGDMVGNNALHEWIRNHKPKPIFCENCKKVPPLDVANISGEYKRDINDFRWLCRKCHMWGDDRIKKLHMASQKSFKKNWRKYKDEFICNYCGEKFIRLKSMRKHEFVYCSMACFHKNLKEFGKTKEQKERISIGTKRGMKKWKLKNVQ